VANKFKIMGYKNAAQRKAAHANKADGGKGHPDNKKGPGKKKLPPFLEYKDGKVVKKKKDGQEDGPGKKGDIKIDPKNKGKFTAWAKKNMPGKDTCGAAKSVMSNKKKYTARVVKMANFAKNFACKK